MGIDLTETEAYNLMIFLEEELDGKDEHEQEGIILFKGIIKKLKEATKSLR